MLSVHVSPFAKNEAFSGCAERNLFENHVIDLFLVRLGGAL